MRRFVLPELAAIVSGNNKKTYWGGNEMEREWYRERKRETETQRGSEERD